MTTPTTPRVIQEYELSPTAVSMVGHLAVSVAWTMGALAKSWRMQEVLTTTSVVHERAIGAGAYLYDQLQQQLRTILAQRAKELTGTVTSGIGFDRDAEVPMDPLLTLLRRKQVPDAPPSEEFIAQIRTLLMGLLRRGAL